MAEHRINTAFVTGAAGFVGSCVVQRLLQDGVAVRALVRSAPPQSSLLAGLEVELVLGDLLAPAQWVELLRGCDTVVHVAGFYSAQPSDAQRLYAVNVGGTQAVMQAASQAGVQRVVHTSTVGTIGRPAGSVPPTEETPFNLWRGASDYVRSKWLGEAAALWWNRRGLPVVVVHPTGPVGAGDWKPTATGQRIVDFLAGRRPDYPSGGMNLCPVEDMAAGHVLAAQRGQPGRRYILGHHAGNLDADAFLRLLAAASGLPVPRPVVRATGRRPLSLTANPQRAIAELGMPQSDLQAALAQEIEFYRPREHSRST